MPGNWPNFATSGILASGAGLVLAWPEPHEFDGITALRNRDTVAQWFLNPRKLNPAANREWLAAGMRRGAEGLLAIRLAETQALLGTIGWTDLCFEKRTACFGRLMVDPRAIVRSGGRWRRDHSGIAVTAATILRDYAFEAMALDDLTTWYFVDNQLAARVNAAIGMEIEGHDVRRRQDGGGVATVELRLTRRRWLELIGAP